MMLKKCKDIGFYHHSKDSNHLINLMALFLKIRRCHSKNQILKDFGMKIFGNTYVRIFSKCNKT